MPPWPWTDLGGGVRVRRSRAYAMNSVLLLDPAHAVLVDPGVLPSELDDLAAAVRDAGAARGHARLHPLPLGPRARPAVVARRRPPSPTPASPPAAGARGGGHRRRRRRLHAARSASPGARGFAPFVPDVAAQGETERGARPVAARAARRSRPLRRPRHACTCRRGGLLVAGDLLSDLEIPWLDREPAVYRRTIEGIAALVEAGEVETLVPGHGAIARGAGAVRARVRRDLRYLEALEEGVREARAAGLTLEQALARLAAIAPGDCGDDFPMADVHRGNVRLAWEGAAPR